MEVKSSTLAKRGRESATSSSLADNFVESVEEVNPGGARKKRPRESKRASTTVFTTDASNFRDMVHEFTGIPSPPTTTWPTFAEPAFMVRPSLLRRQTSCPYYFGFNGRNISWVNSQGVLTSGGTGPSRGGGFKSQESVKGSAAGLANSELPAGDTWVSPSPSSDKLCR